MPNRTLCVAPMMDWTNRHCRYFMRLISPNALLYTEMVTAHALLNSPSSRLLAFSDFEQPVALQLGGANPEDLAVASKIGADYGYSEINLNVGCPSDRVQSGQFGACLMKTPKIVADCVAAMSNQVKIPVTVKTRLGVDHDDSYEFLAEFISTVASAGVNTFIVHARKAWLSGLSPKQNRSVPPLDYSKVIRLKEDFPELEIIINGGISTIAEVMPMLQRLDGVMLGRAAYHNPKLLEECEQHIFNQSLKLDYNKVIHDYCEYMREQMQLGVRIKVLLKPIFGLFHASHGAKTWRRSLTAYSQIETFNIDDLQTIAQQLICSCE